MSANLCSCAYCTAAFVTRGDLYSARVYRQDVMEEIDSGMFGLRLRGLETTDHVSRLSVRFVIDGLQSYRLGGSRYQRIDPLSYVVINQGQTYATTLETEGATMIGVAFRPSLAADVIRCAMVTDDRLIDTDPITKTSGLALGDRVMDLTEPMAAARRLVLDAFRRPHLGPMDLAPVFTHILELVVQQHHGMLSASQRLEARRDGTRVELLRRLSVGKDYLTAMAHENVTIADAAREACLSEYHFIRSFRDLYGVSPYTWLTEQRIRQAQVLLTHTRSTVDDIAVRVGFENTSAFVRRFRLMLGTTPARWRRAA
ncbi:MAG TPA: hypothetical protein DIS79_10640 [Bacteroidetes bacterium]|nr:hypothetical protein [Bacteroidota bacterium]HRK04277.1 AraC family transcriptional regulator [Chlorobiota bacterium]